MLEKFFILQNLYTPEEKRQYKTDLCSLYDSVLGMYKKDNTSRRSRYKTLMFQINQEIKRVNTFLINEEDEENYRGFHDLRGSLEFYTFKFNKIRSIHGLFDRVFFLVQRCKFKLNMVIEAEIVNDEEANKVLNDRMKLFGYKNNFEEIADDLIYYRDNHSDVVASFDLDVFLGMVRESLDVICRIQEKEYVDNDLIAELEVSQQMLFNLLSKIIDLIGPDQEII